MAHTNWEMRGQFNKGTVYRGVGRAWGTIREGSLCSTLGLITRVWYIPRPEGRKEGVMLKPGGRDAVGKEL